MINATKVFDLPTTAAVYALYGGTGPAQYVAYIGIAKDLRNKIHQHLIRRDSSVATGTSATSLNPDYVTKVRWWNHRRFRTRAVLEAALRSRGRITSRAKELYGGKAFFQEMEALFRGKAAGELRLSNLQEASERITTLEERVAKPGKSLAAGMRGKSHRGKTTA